MQHVLDHADLFLVFSGLVAVFAASLVAAALGLESRSVALAATLIVGVVHGALGYAIHRLKREAYEPPALRIVEVSQEAA